MKKGIIYFTLAFFALSSCRKEELPTQEVHDPDFYMKGKLNDAPLLMQAGVEDYYMHASYYQDSNGVYVLKANLKKEKCGGCGYDLTVLINDHMTSPSNAPIEIDSALRLGHYLYNDKSLAPTQFVASIVPQEPFNSTSAYSWTVTDGNTSVIREGYNLLMVLDVKNIYTINLRVDDGVGCFTTHKSTFNLMSALQTNIKATRTGNLSELRYTFTTDPILSGNYQYVWDFGDGQTSTELNPEHVFSVLGTGYYNVGLTVINPGKDTSYSFYQLGSSLDPVCVANFNAKFTPIPNLKAYTKVTILLKDEKGVEYSTRDFIQPESSVFKVLEIADYKTNAQGPTKKYKASFNCVLRNGANEVKVCGETVLAVGYKN
jgi:hypothetical protein